MCIRDRPCSVLYQWSQGDAYCQFEHPARQRAEGHDHHYPCLLYTSDAADERSSVDLGGRRIIKKKYNVAARLTLLSHFTTH